MIVWGGKTSYRTSAADITPLVIAGHRPAKRQLRDAYHAAVWTGSEMIIWGGLVPANDARQLSTQTLAGNTIRARIAGWLLTTMHAPTGRWSPTAVWTGSEMIVWGGYSYDTTDHFWNTGGRYDPSTDSWVATSITNAPDGRESAHGSVDRQCNDCLGRIRCPS